MISKQKSSLSSRLRTFGRILKYLSRFRILLAVSLLFTAASVALTLYIPILVGNAIDFALGEGMVFHEKIAAILLKILIAILITSLLQWLINIINNKMTYEIVKKLRHEAFVKIQSFPVSYIDSHKGGDVVSRLITDTDQFSDGLLMGLTQFFNGIFTIVGTLIFMLSISYKIAIVVVILTPISLFVAAYIAKNTFSMFKLQSGIRGEQTSLIDEAVTQHKTVVAFSEEANTVSKFNEINDRLSKASLRAIFFSSLTNPCTRFVNSVIYAVVTLIGALSFFSGGINITVGQLSSFLSYANQYTKPFNEISGVVTELQNALACADRVFEIIDDPTKVENPTEPQNIANRLGKVEFENISFSYSPDTKLIEDFSFTALPGQRIAIVGPTGCGKTTLINLIMRFYDVNKGAIKIDGVNVKDIDRTELRDMLGMVLQDTWLAPGTIRENIAFGKPDATDYEIIEAAKKAHAHSFIKRLENGYDTVISESVSLSQGQKQLICIARLMLVSPEILILDEATSSIDTITEMKIQSAFASVMQGKTSFIVAHRLSTIKEADVILVMKDGNIIEQGSHYELLSQKGFYAKLFLSQFPNI